MSTVFVSYIVPLSILLPIVICLVNFSKAKVGHKLLFYYLVASGLINLGGLMLVRYHMQNLPLLHLYTTVETVLILSYFRAIFPEPAIKRTLLCIIILFPILCILNFTFLQSIYTFNTHTRPLEAILITFFCMLYLYKSGFTENWLSRSINWLNIGILIYFPAACIIFILSNYLVFVKMNRPMNSMVWNVHAGLVLIMYLIWAKGFSLIKNER